LVKRLKEIHAYKENPEKETLDVEIYHATDLKKPNIGPTSLRSNPHIQTSDILNYDLEEDGPIDEYAPTEESYQSTVLSAA
jgi:hypothetical protein